MERPLTDAWDRHGPVVEDARARIRGAAAALPAQAAAQPLSPPGAPGPSRGPDPACDWGDLTDQAAALASGALTPSAAVAAALDVAARHGARLHAVTALESDRAMAEARAMDARDPSDRGPLAGAPYARKDLFHRKGFAALCGSPLMPTGPRGDTATVLTRMDAAGGIDIGRAAMAELAMSPTGFNAHAPHPRNPWNEDHAPGGSSSGSAVLVAAGAVRVALGTDTGGSIRHPASMCGLTGLKPTAGRIGAGGAWPLSWSLDCIGPLARSARDCALALEIMAGADPHDSAAAAPGWRRPELTGDLSGIRIAVPGGYYAERLTPAIAAGLGGVRAALIAAGATLIETAPPDMALVNALAHIMLTTEAAAQLRGPLMTADERIGRQVRERLEPGLIHHAADYAAALRLRAPVREGWIAAVMAGVQAALLPSICIEVPRIDDADPGTVAALTHATRGINALGLPALSAPCGRDAAGLPIGFQLVARAWDEAALIRIADAYQRRTSWHVARPSLT